MPSKRNIRFWLAVVGIVIGFTTMNLSATHTEDVIANLQMESPTAVPGDG